MLGNSKKKKKSLTDFVELIVFAQRILFPFETQHQTKIWSTGEQTNEWIKDGCLLWF